MAMRVRRLLLPVLLSLSGLIILTVYGTLVFSLAATENQAAGERGLFMVGAGIGAGLAMLGAGVGMGTASAAAIGAIAEKPELLGRTLLYIVLIEAIAIYGLVIFFIIYSRI